MGIWTQLTHFDRTKVQPSIGMRNAVGLAIPLGFAVAVGEPFFGFLGSLGAMNAALSDGGDPYLPRGRRMLAASALSALAVAAGATAGAHPVVSGILIAVWALGAGLLVALDTAAADIGLLSLVMVLVFVGQPMAPYRAVTAGLIALAGGCLQTLLSVALWPFRRYEPERRVIAALYSEISAMAAAPIRTSEPPRATAEANEAQAVIRTLGRSHTVQGDRYVSLVSQAERIRLTLFAIREAPFLKEVSRIADAIARTLKGEQPTFDPEWLEAVQHQTLAGQLRAAWDLAVSSTLVGRVAFERRQLTRPWRLRVESSLETLSANLTLRSSAMRHAVRLTAAVLTGEILAHVTGGVRSYWLPMTAAIVLKPDFTATFSRGLLRIAGTVAGLALATALFSWAAPTPLLELAIVFVIVFVFRAFGPAHYGILTASLTAYIVVIFALAGQAPRDVIRERAIHTVLGGALALIVYVVWPTWERSQIRDVLAKMLAAYRRYLRAVLDQSPDLDYLRLEGRLARSNAQAALDRFLSEPGSDPAVSALLSQVMASSHRVVHAMMAFEAGLTERSPELLSFAYKVEITLHSLAAALQGSPLNRASLPDLRSAQTSLAQSGHALAADADRLTNSLNTLTEQVLRMVAEPIQAR
ncbi:MAG TPA: FUSC family protein [Bryobacteraceae bacterium]|nr:FUSC family protein [Bryobacteraceae bacterium]